jgi:hypothetical protein
MDATGSLLNRIRNDFPDVRFLGEIKTARDQATLLHELGHALARHHDFSKDIDLLKMEREAWTKAEALAPDYEVAISEETIEEALDSYRDWLHARSRCPNCSQTGIQYDENTYHCLLCHLDWRVNDARQCGLRRYKLTTT